MSRLVSLAAAVATSITLLASAGGHAQAPAGYYVAVPATQPTRASLVTRSTPWTLRDGAYVAARAPERDQTLCQLVARSAGALSSFAVAGKPYDADALAKCNAKAR